MYAWFFRIVLAAGVAAVCYGYVNGGAHILVAFAAHKGLIIKDGQIWRR